MLGTPVVDSELALPDSQAIPRCRVAGVEPRLRALKRLEIRPFLLVFLFAEVPAKGEFSVVC